ncbi:unnamed protein product, partial [Larinioides sclopetarius]
MIILKLKRILSNKKKFKKRSSKSDSESDVDSIVYDEEDRDSIISAKSKRVSKEKPWNESITSIEKQDNYDVLISDDLKLVEEKI